MDGSPVDRIPMDLADVDRADHARGEAIDTDTIMLDRRQAWRLGAWASLALVAVALAYLAARSETGTQRLAALTEPKPAPSARGAPMVERPFDAEIEARRLNEAVRLLAADRDRLLARINSLERSLDDVTGSIGNPAATPASGTPPAAAASPASSPLPPSLTPSGAPLPSPGQLAPEPISRQAPEPQAVRPQLEPLPPAAAPKADKTDTRAPEVAARPEPSGRPAAPARPGAPAAKAGQQAAVQPGPGAAESIVTRTEFGIDLGGHSSVEGLRSLWNTLRTRHGPLFEGLRPLINVREGKKPGELELRLVAGPLANAGAAARLCAAFSAAGRSCQPAVFDGQRLALQ